MIFEARKGQTNYGEAIGILLLETSTPFIQGDVGNATSYDYPVRYLKVNGLTAERIFSHDYGFLTMMIDGAKELEREGVKAITGDCGFMAIYQREVREAVSTPVFLSSLLQVPFIKLIIPQSAKIGILTANSKSLTADVFEKIGVSNDGLVVRGLEGEKNFKDAVIDEIGILNSDGMREEMVAAAERMIMEQPEIRAILLECSMMPPYGEAIQRATGLPVFDFLSMIDHVYSSLVKKRFADTM
jgi:aspartate/glutamate racemase